MTTHFVMLVKDALKKEVSVVVELRGAVCRDLYPGTRRRNTNIHFSEAPTDDPSTRTATRTLLREII